MSDLTNLIWRMEAWLESKPFSAFCMNPDEVRAALRTLEARSAIDTSEPTLEILTAMATELGMMKSGDMLTLDWMAILKRQYLAAIKASGLAAAPVAAPTGQILRAGDVKPPQAIVNALGQPVAATGAQEAVAEVEWEICALCGQEPFPFCATRNCPPFKVKAPQPVASAPEEKDTRWTLA